MPIKVRSKKMPPQREGSPVPARSEYYLPEIATDDSFRVVVKKLSLFFVDAIDLPSTFEQLRTTAAGTCLRVLVDHLAEKCTNPAIVNALLALKWHYDADRDNRFLAEARSSACEIVAWRFLTRLSERDAVDYCLYEIPDPNAKGPTTVADVDEEAGELSPLLDHFHHGEHHPDHHHRRNPVGGTMKRSQLLSSLSKLTMTMSEQGDDDEENDPTAAFITLNALEIAAIANAKRFLSQHIVQKIMTAIWSGDIIFWESLSLGSVKKHRFYNPRTADPFSRLRVPKYLKTWEVFFFAVFLGLYYAVLITRSHDSFTIPEFILFFWIAAFFYDELSEWLDAGSIFYAADVWNLFDMIMIIIGFIFAVMRIVGVTQEKPHISELAFDILSLEALFMIPRVFSILSLSPSWGTLIPCLKEMGKDFFKYMVLVIVVYCGFLTTFSLVGRDVYPFQKMAWILTKIFYGSPSTGFDVMKEVDPLFGPPLMLVFLTLSTFLLMGSLTGMLSNSFSRVMAQAKEEYLYVYSVYVLEASTSNRLTHFYPPFNLLAFAIFRPWRLIFGSDDRIRAGRIMLLKLTHWPMVIIIRLYEMVRCRSASDAFAGFKGPSPQKRTRRGLSRKASSSSESKAAGVEADAAVTAVQSQLSELNHKLDLLTAAVAAMQEKQAAASA